MRSIAQQVAHDRLQKGGVVGGAGIRSRLENQLQTFLFDGFTPQRYQVDGDFLKGRTRRHVDIAVLGPGQHQEGLHQLTHFLAGAGYALDLGPGARVQLRVFQQ
ncbi:hypothetical protein D3C80_1172920 [compost metagenome]